MMGRDSLLFGVQDAREAIRAPGSFSQGSTLQGMAGLVLDSKVAEDDVPSQ